MPVTRKQKNKTRRSREADMISDLENMDVMRGSSHYEREDREFGNSLRKLESPSNDALVDHNSNFHFNSTENDISWCTGNGRSSGETDSSSELNRLSGDLNQRITQEVNGLMSIVSMQIQSAINEAVNEHVLSQIQAYLRSINEQPPQKGWNFPGEIPERKSENALNRNARSTSGDELLRYVNHNKKEKDTPYSSIRKQRENLAQ